MNSLEFNKIAAAMLVAGILTMLLSMFGSSLIVSQVPEKPSYVVAGVAQQEAPKAAESAPAAEEIPPVAPLLASADVGKGEAVAKKCAACHSFDKGGATKVGPNLWGIVGNTHAHVDGFAYSAAIAGMKGKPWSYEELNHFIANPKGYAPGTKMSFAGLKSVQERADVIAWLRTLSDQPQPLPQ